MPAKGVLMESNIMDPLRYKRLHEFLPGYSTLVVEILLAQDRRQSALAGVHL